jgi:hypothetical protein
MRSMTRIIPYCIHGLVPPRCPKCYAELEEIALNQRRRIQRVLDWTITAPMRAPEDRAQMRWLVLELTRDDDSALWRNIEWIKNYDDDGYLLPSVAQKVDTGGDGPGRDGT